MLNEEEKKYFIENVKRRIFYFNVCKKRMLLGLNTNVGCPESGCSWCQFKVKNLKEAVLSLTVPNKNLDAKYNFVYELSRTAMFNTLVSDSYLAKEYSLREEQLKEMREKIHTFVTEKKLSSSSPYNSYEYTNLEEIYQMLKKEVERNAK